MAELGMQRRPADRSAASTRSPALERLDGEAAIRGDPRVAQLAAYAEMANGGPRVARLGALQAMANGGARPASIQRFHVATPVVDEATLRQNVGEALQAGETLAGGGQLLNKPGNVAKLMPVVSDPLQGDVADVPRSAMKQQWLERAFDRVERGAQDLISDVQHWGGIVAESPDMQNCTVLAVELTGADLHERGLGVAKLDLRFERNVGGPRPSATGSGAVQPGLTLVTPNAWQVETRSLILKPDDRNFERLLLGRGVGGNGSAAEQLNARAGLADNSIETIPMATSPGHGTVVAYVENDLISQLQSWKRWLTRDDQPFVEAVAFAMLAGIWDLHEGNVIIKGGKPVLIDAEVGLQPHVIRDQHAPGHAQIRNAGLPGSAHARVDAQAAAQGQASRLLDWARQNPQTLQDIIKQTIGDAWARVVPVFTASWSLLKNDFLVGHLNALQQKRDRALDGGVDALTGNPPPNVTAPGLAAQVGNNQGAALNRVAERGRIEQDFMDGAIPEFNYQPSTGRVAHRGQVIWRGADLDDSMTILRGRLAAM